jgi:hypothetical protein
MHKCLRSKCITVCGNFCTFFRAALLLKLRVGGNCDIEFELKIKEEGG